MGSFSVFPALAGVILDKYVKSHGYTCFSRTRGGDPALLAMFAAAFTFFPHSRGWSHHRRLVWLTDKVFPALAGVIPKYPFFEVVKACFSRTRGGDPESSQLVLNCFLFFPHSRGWSQSLQTFQKLLKVFPALAGVILRLPDSFDKKAGFSRTRGGDPRAGRRRVHLLKFFPHSRGWS